MSAEPALTAEQDEHLQDMTRHVRALEGYPPAELADLYASPGLEDAAKQVVKAVAALQGSAGTPAPDVMTGRMDVEIKYAGPARKVSVSLPEDLTVAVQQRVGRGKFSQYVTEAVARQLERDLLAELAELLAAEHGPVSGDYLAEARAAWPDGD